jgi:hypothetical protein
VEARRPHRKQVPPNLLELHLSAAELQRQLDALPLAQELLSVAQLDL